MANQQITPKRWRQHRNMSMAGMAAMLGIGGKNPARTWQRYETGAIEPPLSLVARLEMISEGKVTTSAWLSVRQGFLAAMSQEV